MSVVESRGFARPTDTACTQEDRGLVKHTHVLLLCVQMTHVYIGTDERVFKVLRFVLQIYSEELDEAALVMGTDERAATRPQRTLLCWLIKQMQRKRSNSTDQKRQDEDFRAAENTWNKNTRDLGGEQASTWLA